MHVHAHTHTQRKRSYTAMSAAAAAVARVSICPVSNKYSLLTFTFLLKNRRKKMVASGEVKVKKTDSPIANSSIAAFFDFRN